MKNWRNQLNRWMQGRYGMDQLGMTLTYGSMAVMVLSVLLQSRQLNLLVTLMLAWEMYRAFSRDLSRRYQENQKFLELKSRLLFRRQGDPDHRIYRCPTCGQKVRVPKGKGKIAIRCPKCRTEFIKKT